MTTRRRLRPVSYGILYPYIYESKLYFYQRLSIKRVSDDCFSNTFAHYSPFRTIINLYKSCRRTRRRRLPPLPARRYIFFTRQQFSFKFFEKKAYTRIPLAVRHF